MNVTYKDLKEGYILKIDDDIVIHSVKHRVRPSFSDKEYYLRYDRVSGNALRLDRIPKASGNNFIFQLLHISDKDSFVKEIAGKAFSGAGSFPQVKTLEALTKVAIALFEKPLYNVGDYVTIREEIEGYKYSLYYLSTMRELAGKTFYVTKVGEKDSFDNITDGEIYQYKLNYDYWWDIAMIMPATEEEKKSAMASDKKEPEEKKEEGIHYVTLEDLKGGYIFKESDHIRINELDCIIYKATSCYPRIWLSSDTVLEQEIYDSLEISDDKKKELAKSCGATDLNFESPEFSNLNDLSNFVKKILMYKKEDKTLPEKKWSGNPTYFDLKGGAILKKGDTLNIHGIKYRVTCGASTGNRCWLSASSCYNNDAIFDKLLINDKYAFVSDICSVVNNGGFPEVGSYEDLTKVVIALYEVPEFKVGDKVRVIHREEDKDEYPYSFVDDMTKLEDEEFTVKSCEISTCYTLYTDGAKKRLSEDPHVYNLEGDARFSWHSSMLERVRVSESDKKSEKSSKEETTTKPLQITLSDLQSGYILKDNDIICLCDEKYKVYCGYGCYFLSNISGGYNHSVFDKLGIRDKVSFCSQFGNVSIGDFPEFKRQEDLTKCVIELMKRADRIDSKAQEPFAASMDYAQSEETTDTGTVRLPEIKDDFKIIL